MFQSDHSVEQAYGGATFMTLFKSGKPVEDPQSRVNTRLTDVSGLLSTRLPQRGYFRY